MRYLLNISPNAEKIISQMIFVTGGSRTGTTILAKLIHSAEKVELKMEPPLFFSLLPLIKQLPEHQFKLLFETHCYEDLFLGDLAGRSLNFNKNDDSCIFEVKDANEISIRINQSHKKLELEKTALNYRFGVKVPDVIPFLPRLFEYYPKIKCLVIVREANDTINSILKKQWYRTVEKNTPAITWPFYVIDDYKIPFWVDLDKVDWWIKASEIERSAYYYIQQMEALPKITDKTIVKYEDLIASPDKVIETLFSALDLRITPSTNKLLESVKFQNKERVDCISQLPTKMQAKILKINALYKF